ncbi:MAG: hypothetical protein LRY27_02015 [Chitinophagales bacterium]|nr:hypothetical protein [Chitinophagales bacterium]
MYSFIKQGASARAITFGMPGWEKLETISLESLSKNNFHFSQSWWIDEDDNRVKSFMNTYERRFKKHLQKMLIWGMMWQLFSSLK